MLPSTENDPLEDYLKCIDALIITDKKMNEIDLEPEIQTLKTERYAVLSSLIEIAPFCL